MLEITLNLTRRVIYAFNPGDGKRIRSNMSEISVDDLLLLMQRDACLLSVMTQRWLMMDRDWEQLQKFYADKEPAQPMINLDSEAVSG